MTVTRIPLCGGKELVIRVATVYEQGKPKYRYSFRLPNGSMLVGPTRPGSEPATFKAGYTLATRFYAFA